MSSNNFIVRKKQTTQVAVAVGEWYLQRVVIVILAFSLIHRCDAEHHRRQRHSVHVRACGRKKQTFNRGSKTVEVSNLIRCFS